jgi:membrane-bound lytic murein transglycosylase A
VPPVPPSPPTPPPAPPPEAPVLLPPQAVAWSQIPGWYDDKLAEAWPAFRQSCRSLARQPAWQAACANAAGVDGTNGEAVRRWFETNFTPWVLRRSDGRDGLVTGYYEPLLLGSRTATTAYRVPLYRVPEDLVTVDLGDVYPELKTMRLRGRLDQSRGRPRLVPYWSRADIDAGRAPFAGNEIVWVGDAVEAFFLQVQGSGRVRLDDGSMIRLSYADQNGYPYHSIGKVLVERGDLPLERASMQGIKAWGVQNPDKLPGLLAENPSYVFFREMPMSTNPMDGPPGALGVPLTGGRSIAVDTKFIPLGTPIFLATTWPNTEQPLDRLVLAQDTGGAIRGPLRADFFWGFGEEASNQAGKMKQAGAMWLLWPAGATPPGTSGRP